LFGSKITSKSPFRAVAVWATISLLVHLMVSPTLAEASAGEISRFLHHDLDCRRLSRHGQRTRGNQSDNLL
jgi:hypothetical protein